MKLIIIIVILLIAFVGCSSEITAPTQSSLPVIGSNLVIDGVNTIVVGAGDTPFEYVGNDESLILVDTINEGYNVVIVPKQGAVVKVIPNKPSLTIDGEEQLNEYSVPSTFVLVEYDRENN